MKRDDLQNSRERERTLSSGLRLKDHSDFRNLPETPDPRRFRKDNMSFSDAQYQPPSYVPSYAGPPFNDSYDHGESPGHSDYVAKVENIVATEAGRLQKGEKIYLKDLSV